MLSSYKYEVLTNFSGIYNFFRYLIVLCVFYFALESKKRVIIV